MSVNLIASRYAKSLLELAKEQNKLDVIYKDIEALNEATKNRDLFLMLRSPIINATKKASILKAIFDGKLDELSMAFIDIIVKKGRESILPEIANDFVAQYKRNNQITTVSVISAAPLSADVLNNIEKELKNSSHTDKDIELNVEVDPALIGGFVLKIGDKLYDASVAHQIKKLRKEFSATSN